MTKKKEYPPMSLVKEFRFGKYKHLTVENVINQDAGYIKYMIGEKIIELDNEAYEYFENVVATS